MSTHKIEIAGWGLATPLGIDAPSNWDALLAGRFISEHSLVPISSNETSRVSQLAVHVARQAIAHSRWNSSTLSNDDTALIIATSKGPIVDWLKKVPCEKSPSLTRIVPSPVYSRGRVREGAASNAEDTGLASTPDLWHRQIKSAPSGVSGWF